MVGYIVWKVMEDCGKFWFKEDEICLPKSIFTGFICWKQLQEVLHQGLAPPPLLATTLANFAKVIRIMFKLKLNEEAPYFLQMESMQAILTNN